MPVMPPCWLPRPPIALDAKTRSGFDDIYERHIRSGSGQAIAYNLAAPKWAFLAYLGDRYPVALHGSGQDGIALFEPRQANDTLAFGNQAAVYASSDGLWPMYFAVIDRDRYPMTLLNSCARLQASGEALSDPFYFFSVSQTARVQQPWREGVVYILPAATFVRQPAIPFGTLSVHVAQAASLTPVKPLACLAVQPADFPFLDQVRGHDDAVVAARAKANPDGFPWLDDEA